ncbi:MAG: hypothetical protein PHY93_00700 [Bacteriovorax sp.]|nr:hypothetical protein [Bacteriovorax sp.]
MKTYKFLFIIMLILPLKAFAVLEFDFDFGYDKQIYGAQRQNSVVSRNYSVGISSYLFDLTALDLNVSSTRDTTSQNDRYTVATGTDVISQQNRVQTNVFGLGLKQMLAGRGARITPIISAGYAREFVTSSGDITVEDTTNLTQRKFNLKESKQRYNSVFGSFILQIKLTERFSLKGSVKTLFPAFEFNKARDNIKYLVGFAWVF